MSIWTRIYDLGRQIKTLQAQIKKLEDAQATVTTAPVEKESEELITFDFEEALDETD